MSVESFWRSVRFDFKFMQVFQQINSFLIGGVSGAFATCIIQPIDALKVQIQVISEKVGKSIHKKNPLCIFTILQQINKNKGFAILYRGLDSAIYRQLVCTSARIGPYNYTVTRRKKQGREVKNSDKILLSLGSGALGALVGNPFDVALIRRQVSITTGKYTYYSTYNAFETIISNEGILGLWAGIRITIVRMMLINVSQLAFKEILGQKMSKLISGHKMLCDNLTALIASAFTSFISLPADNLKVKLQKQIKGEEIYSGIINCLTKTIKREGFSRLWVGFPIYFIRGAPHSFILIRTQQTLNRYFQQPNN